MVSRYIHHGIQDSLVWIPLPWWSQLVTLGMVHLYPSTRCIHQYLWTRCFLRYPWVSRGRGILQGILRGEACVGLAYICIQIVHHCLVPDVSMGIHYPGIQGYPSRYPPRLHCFESTCRPDPSEPVTLGSVWHIYVSQLFITVLYQMYPLESRGIQRYPWVSSRASLFWIHLPPRSHPSQWPLDRPAHLLLRNAGTAVSAKDGPTDLD